ncbi:GGDEF domain-containing protein [Pseudomonas amygdali pv. lachrymans]|nr:GGDEF domain-containing protein [Pseudomonas amygdali pv. lachrymans]RMP33918.1 GGDEF domain-containing protein [Pseudomonas amygdali pv. lachrymans]RMV54282.1 GGDEF domain-containing protein [Pseudomonas amygdali pv. lachrymans]
MMMTLPTEDRTQLFKDTAIQFWKHITPIVYVALGIHCVLLMVFLGLGMKVLWVANIVSTLLYINCLYLIRRQRYRQAGQLMCLEIIGHALLATWELGWESNFSFYLFCVIPIIAFTFQLVAIRRIAYSLAILLSLVGCFAFRRHMGQESGLSQNLLDAFGIVNALVATVLSIYATALSVRFTSSMQLSLFHIANRDSLTNLYTRRRVLHRIRELEARRQGFSASLILLDIDHFKQINDLHGHETGDAVLQRVAEVISSSVRNSDMAARWGGEEFLVLMPDTAPDDALRVAERIWRRIAEEAGQIDERSIAVTATLAMATLAAGETFQITLNRADTSLYLGKQQGRNRVMIAG